MSRYLCRDCAGFVEFGHVCKVKIRKLESQNKKLVEALKHYVTGEHYKMRSNGRLVTPEIAETVLKEVENGN